MISYIDDKNLIAQCAQSRKWGLINSLEFSSFSQIVKNRRTYAVILKDIVPLSNLYAHKFVSVSFGFKDISREYSLEDEESIDSIIAELISYMNDTSAYFVIKIPSHITTLLSAISKKRLGVFAGGTVCYLHATEPDHGKNEKVDVRVLDVLDFDKYKTELLTLGIDGFTNYFGQYHIIQYTRPKAGKIYENWVKEYIQENRGITFGAFKGDELVGFLSCDRFGSVLELVLSAVSKNARGMGVYESMIRASTEYGFERKQIITTSTQFDNFEVQRAWINTGFKPYYSFYLYHNNGIKD